MYIENGTDQREDFVQSRFGYGIEPNGTILSLTELQVHGQIAYDRNAEVREYYDNLEEDRKSRTKMAAETFACEDLGHVRISIAPYIYQWSVSTSFSKPLTGAQKKALRFLFEVCGQDECEIWTNTGEMFGEDFLRSL